MTVDSLGTMNELPSEMKPLIGDLGKIWAKHPARPRIPARIVEAWDGLLEGWIDSDLPLVIRKGGGVGGSQIQHSTGRRIVIADNSPAQWVFSQAIRELTFEVEDIRRVLEFDEIPFAFATKTAEKERMAYKRTLQPKNNLNKRGWKLCHIDRVGLSTKTPIESVELEIIYDRFRKLLSPSNHFLVPLQWGGLGELEEFIAGVRMVHRNDSG